MCVVCHVYDITFWPVYVSEKTAWVGMTLKEWMYDDFCACACLSFYVGDSVIARARVCVCMFVFVHLNIYICVCVCVCMYHLSKTKAFLLSEGCLPMHI